MDNNIAAQEQILPATPKRDIQQQVTDAIIQQLEAGTIPWQQPWIDNRNQVLAIPKNATTGNKYRGINILLLWSSSLVNEFETSQWATFKQWNEKKEFIRKGEKGSMIVYYDRFQKEVDGEVQDIPFIKTSIVFNQSQLASYTPIQNELRETGKALFEIIDPVDEFISNTNAIIEHNNGRAYYNPSTDRIALPFTNLFQSTEHATATEGYYSTLLHELTHWTAHEKRLNRQLGKKFGDKHYACEELVAELGAAFLCAGFEIGRQKTKDHAAYISFWLDIFKSNKQFIFTAASEASKAVDYLNDLQPK